MVDAAKKIGKTYFCVTLLAFAQGCCRNTVSVITTDMCEGRYESRESLVAAAEGVNIDKKHPVWLISAETMKTIIKEAGNRK